jgi:methyl-accepting chemotaxis protein
MHLPRVTRSLRARLLAGYGVLAAMCLLLGVGGLVLTARTQARLSTVYEDRVLPLQQLPAVRFALTAAAAEGAPDRASLRRRADSAWGAYLGTRLTVEEARLAGRTKASLAAAWDVVGRGAAGAPARAAVTAAQADLGALIDLQVRVAGAENVASQAAYRQGLWAAVVGTLLAVVVAVVVGLRTARHVCGGIGAVQARAESLRAVCGEGLTRALEAMGRGDLSVNVEPRTTPVPIQGDDEIAALGGAVNGLLAQMRASLTAYAETRDAIGALVEETRGLTVAARAGRLAERGQAARFAGAYRELVDGVNATLDAVVTPVGEARAVLARVADRDLAARMTGSYAGEFADMQRSVNTAAANLDAALSEVAGGSAQVAAAAGQIAGGSQTLASGASEQAASLEEVSANLHEVAAMARQSAGNAQEARALADAAGRRAVEGVERAGRLAEAVGAIQRASAETAAIVRTIDEIAFQTNLLALNAAVEAARAGDAGRGFAVVAEEVRTLAQRSAEAARRTAELVAEGRASAEAGVAVTADVRTSLEEIRAEAGRVAAVVAEISAAVDQQAQGVAEVNQALGQMNTVTQQVAANAEESASAAEELSGQAATMQAVVARFRLSGEPEPDVDPTLRPRAAVAAALLAA